MRQRQNSNYYATSLKHVSKKLKKIFIGKNLNHVWETQGKHKLINDIKGTNRKSSLVPALNSCSERCTDPSSADIAEQFNTFFTNVGPKLKEKIKHLTEMNEVNHFMYIKPITIDEAREIIENLDNKFSSGDDDISSVIKVIIKYHDSIPNSGNQ